MVHGGCTWYAYFWPCCCCCCATVVDGSGVSEGGCGGGGCCSFLVSMTVRAVPGAGAGVMGGLHHVRGRVSLLPTHASCIISALVLTGVMCLRPRRDTPQPCAIIEAHQHERLFLQLPSRRPPPKRFGVCPRRCYLVCYLAAFPLPRPPVSSLCCVPIKTNTNKVINIDQVLQWLVKQSRG